MAAILSIDFDYFLDVSAKERDCYFPQGSDEIPDDLLALMWKECYVKYPELANVSVINDFDILKEYLLTLSLPKENVDVYDSHKFIQKLINRISKEDPIYVVNIDFHHDYYHYFTGSDEYNCGNWLRRLLEERPETKIKWIRRKDSQIYSLDGEFPFEHTDDIKSICNEKFDYVFLCKSPEWSPPHLTEKFEELISILRA